MIQTKEEMFLAELGINPKEEIEGLYSAKIKIIDLLKKYLKEQLILSGVSNRRELFDDFYKWLDDLTQAEYDDMSLTDKIEKYFFKN